MKTLKITKERFEKSRYFQKKYGKLEYVSESGEIYMTESGELVRFLKEKRLPAKKVPVKKPLNRRSNMDDVEDVSDEVEERPLKGNSRKPKSANKPMKKFRNFNDLKRYIEGEAYDKEVGAAIDGDGRLGSVADEANIIEWLNEIFKGTNVTVGKPKARNWADVELVIDGTKTYYTNIKTTNGGSAADNISSKKGVLYYLTGGQCEDYKRFLAQARRFDFQEVADETKDYFLLVMYKNTKKMMFTSLGRLNVLSPNFNNMPFQIPWGKKENQEPPVREQIDQKKYIAYISRPLCGRTGLDECFRADIHGQ